MALAHAPTPMEVAFADALATTPEARLEHRIVRLDHRCVPHVDKPLRVGPPAPYLQGETARSLQLRCQCIKEQALRDPEGWVWLEMHIAGGRILAQGRWDEHGVHYEVYVVEVNGWSKTIAFSTARGRTQYIKDGRLLTKLMDDLLYDECRDAIYRELDQRGWAHRLDEWGEDQMIRRAMDGVIECAWPPREAADYVAKALVKERG